MNARWTYESLANARETMMLQASDLEHQLYVLGCDNAHGRLGYLDGKIYYNELVPEIREVRDCELAALFRVSCWTEDEFWQEVERRLNRSATVSPLTFPTWWTNRPLGRWDTGTCDPHADWNNGESPLPYAVHRVFRARECRGHTCRDYGYGAQRNRSPVRWDGRASVRAWEKRQRRRWLRRQSKQVLAEELCRLLLEGPGVRETRKLGEPQPAPQEIGDETPEERVCDGCATRPVSEDQATVELVRDLIKAATSAGANTSEMEQASDYEAVAERGKAWLRARSLKVAG